jgi:fructokinase
MNFGSIEAGGTKFVCGIGNELGEVLDRISIPTTTPIETMEKIVSYFKNKDIKSIGLGTFGPADVNRHSKTYGYITSTPKPYWGNFNIVGKLKNHFNMPIGFDTDVNAAALGEMEWGAAKGLDSCVYMTVGTGIGVGAVSEGALLHGMLHPEMGHILIRRHVADKYKGNCPYHHDCLEGLAAGPALEERWGEKGFNLAEMTEVWELESYYLAQALLSYILILSPKKIILGGGVMKQEQLFPLIRTKVAEMLNNYIQTKELQYIDSYIVPPGLGDNAGLCGGLALAKRALR